jgi:hypothetical protein
VRVCARIVDVDEVQALSARLLGISIDGGGGGGDQGATATGGNGSGAVGAWASLSRSATLGTTQRQHRPNTDRFGYTGTPSAALTARALVSSSAAPERRRTHHPLVHSVTGVAGGGRAGRDVRIDYPPRPTLPLHAASLRARLAATAKGGDSGGIGPSGTTPQHLADTMSALCSVPARATWFADPSAVIAALASSTASVVHLALHVRVLPLQTLERDVRLRAAAAAEAGGEGGGAASGSPLPQQPRTELTAPATLPAHRYHVPALGDPAVRSGGGAAVSQQGAQSGAGGLDHGAGAAVESALFQLLRDAVHDSAGL